MEEDVPPPPPAGVEQAGAGSSAGFESLDSPALRRLYATLISPAASIEKVAAEVLEAARSLTGSEHGYATAIDPASGANSGLVLTEPVAGQCLISAEDCRLLFCRGPDGKYPGLWGHALNTRKSFYTNDPPSHPAARGLPESHLPIKNFLSVPVLAGADLVGQIALANAPRSYGDRDLALVERIAEGYALAILRIRAEESLRESEAKHRMIAENLNEGLWCIDLDGHTKFANHRMAEMLGYSLEEFLGRHIFDFADDRGLEVARDHLARARLGILENLEAELVRKDGAHIHVILQTSPVRDARGVHTMAMAGVLDITERKKMEEDLRRERNFVSAVLSTLGALVVVLDRDGRIVRFNRACELLTGYTFEEVKDTPLWDLLLVPEESGSVKDVFSSLRAGQFPIQHENYWVAKDGSRKLIAWSNTVLSGEGGAVEFVIGTGIDVSELRKVESQLRKLNESLEREVSERTAVAEHRAAKLQAMALELTRAEQRERRKLAQVLHDHLQQLLVGARLRAGALRGRLRRSETQKAVADMDALLSQAIEASRSLTIDLSPPILHEEGLCGALRWLARTMEKDHGLDVEVDTGGETGPEDAALSAFLYEACRELLFNVIKHAGTYSARVALQRAGPEHIEVLVEDGGVGFSPPGESDEGPVEGFGLFSIRERIELLGGRMEVRSAAGQGTRVRLRVPLSGWQPHAKKDGLPAAESVASADPLQGPWRKPPVRVLIAGGHGILRSGLAALLGGRKDVAVVGESAAFSEVLEMLERLRPDAVVVGASGEECVEAVRRIHSKHPSVRVIGLSLDGDAGLAGRVLDAGAVTCLGGAGTPESLLEALQGRSLEGQGPGSGEGDVLRGSEAGEK